MQASCDQDATSHSQGKASTTHTSIQAPIVPDVPIIPPMTTHCSRDQDPSISIAGRPAAAQGHMSLTVVIKGSSVPRSPAPPRAPELLAVLSDELGHRVKDLGI